MRIPGLAVTGFMFISGVACFAQTKNADRRVVTKSPVLLKAEADLKSEIAQNQLDEDALKALRAERDQLNLVNQKITEANSVLAEKVFNMVTMLQILNKEERNVPLTDEDKKATADLHDTQLLELGIAIENGQTDRSKAMQRLAADNDATTSKYNSLLREYNDYVQRVNIRMAQIGAANRVSNALALYNAMPKYNCSAPL